MQAEACLLTIYTVGMCKAENITERPIRDIESIDCLCDSADRALVYGTGKNGMFNL